MICNKILLEKCHRNIWNASDYFWPSCMNRASVFEWHERFKEGKKSVRDDERCGRSKELNTPELIGQRVRVRVTMLRFLREFRERFYPKRPALFKSGQWHFHRIMHQSTTLSLSWLFDKMGIKTVPHHPYSPDIALCDFWLFPKLRGCCYETIEEMKEAVMKVIDTLTQEDLPWGLPEVVGMVQQVHCSQRRLLQRGQEFHVCIINKSSHTKKVWNLFNDPHIY